MDDDANVPPPGPKQQPSRTGGSGGDLATGSTATNGYWLHDEFGPAVLVGGVPEPISGVESAILAKFPQLRCESEDGVIRIVGIVDSASQVQEIRQFISEVWPGKPMIIDLVEQSAKEPPPPQTSSDAKG